MFDQIKIWMELENILTMMPLLNLILIVIYFDLYILHDCYPLLIDVKKLCLEGPQVIEQSYKVCLLLPTSRLE